MSDYETAFELQLAEALAVSAAASGIPNDAPAPPNPPTLLTTNDFGLALQLQAHQYVAEYDHSVSQVLAEISRLEADIARVDLTFARKLNGIEDGDGHYDRVNAAYYDLDLATLEPSLQRQKSILAEMQSRYAGPTPSKRELQGNSVPQLKRAKGKGPVKFGADNDEGFYSFEDGVAGALVVCAICDDGLCERHVSTQAPLPGARSARPGRVTTSVFLSSSHRAATTISVYHAQVNHLVWWIEGPLASLIEQRSLEDSLLSNAGADKASKAMYCPNKRCSSMLMIPDDLDPARANQINAYLDNCPRCSTRICTYCRSTAHDGNSCRQMQALPAAARHTDHEDAKLAELVAERDWKQCPWCQHMVELSTGCNHITCRCQHHFCYKCLAPWDMNQKCCSRNPPCALCDEANLIAENQRPRLAEAIST
ncbi:hypothetical protein HDU87_000915 [Geranomyces variabilis]|uniref:RBR-type E3 ubiquitin transferase n=1 Tax=Geranomyces variabilis TaxID=109894 RepID=A0AAD5TBP3_9FUNG|nr:hypothetical protein HDU87_000915 [Geranomyces variabilis]